MTSQIYNELRQSYTLNELANKLSLHAGTLKRWELQKRVPSEYLHDLNALLNYKYSITKENFAHIANFSPTRKLLNIVVIS